MRISLMSDVKKWIQRIAGWDFILEMIAVLILVAIGIIAYLWG